jgi:hypothetical protein
MYVKRYIKLSQGRQGLKVKNDRARSGENRSSKVGNKVGSNRNNRCFRFGVNERTAGMRVNLLPPKVA